MTQAPDTSRHPSIAPQVRPFFWRRHPFLRVALLAVAAFLVLFAAVVFLGGRIDLAHARKAARDRGYALTLTEFAAKLHKADKDKNAAPLYETAMQAYGESKPAQEMLDSAFIPFFCDPGASYRDKATSDAAKAFTAAFYDRSAPFPGKTLADTRLFLDACRDSLDLMRKARDYPDSAYDFWRQTGTAAPETHTHFAGGVPEYGYGVKSLATLATLAAIVEASDQHPREASERLSDAIAVLRSTRNDPASCGYTPLISPGWVLYAPPVTLVCDGLQRVLVLSDVPNEDLALLQSEIAGLAEEIPGSMRLGLERTLADIAEESAGPVIRRVSRYFPEVEKWGIAPQLDRLPPFLLSAVARRDYALAITELVDYLDNAQSPSLQFLKTAGYSTPPALREGRYPRAVDVSTTRGAIRDAALAQAKLRSAAAAVAALRYENDTGAWPETLSSLVPKYLDAVPADPFSASTLLYVDKSPTAIVVYSVGANGVDNFGSETYDQSLTDEGKYGCDVSFAIDLTRTVPNPVRGASTHE